MQSLHKDTAVLFKVQVLDIGQENLMVQVKHTQPTPSDHMLFLGICHV